MRRVGRRTCLAELSWTDEMGDRSSVILAGQWQQARLAEYRSLRDEILLAVGSQLRALSLGITALGLITGFAITHYGHEEGTIVLGVLDPFLAGAALLIWIGHGDRMFRIAGYLRMIERSFACRYHPESPMGWEKWQRSTDNKVGFNHSEFYAQFALVLLIGVSCGALGVVSAGAEKSPILPPALFCLPAAIVGLGNCPRTRQVCSMRWRRRYQRSAQASWMSPR
jgi:hypothetical protein